MELGMKQMARIFPNDILFKPGVNSILDPGLQGTAEYREWLSALYGTYIFELKRLELEAGLRLEYSRVDYLVDPNHAVYKSDGFSYLSPFPNVRFSFLLNEKSKLSLFYNRRVDRPQESALRVFPTYADPEILVIGNPTLVPQFTQSFELGYRRSWTQGYIYAAAYHRITDNLLTRIITEIPPTNLLTSVTQNADKGLNTGLEWVYSQQFGRFRLNANANYYRNLIGAFSITNAYPADINYSRDERMAWTGNVKLNILVRLPGDTELQVTGTYLAPDIIPQGRILARGSVDAGIRKEIQKGKGELFMNASDLFNTLVMKTELDGTGFSIHSKDYYETQVVRVGYQYRF
jgi:outer membrane receptor protein involved in Fe transport